MRNLKSSYVVEKIWKYYSHEERNEIINNHSIGCIENGGNSFIEVLEMKGGILYMDHEDISNDNPFQSLKEVHSNYDWDNQELLDEIEEYKEDGVVLRILCELLGMNK
tara:strand:- start:483 stop:806 length:324 start_codon:yes stop_codon:yes gene_type:complete